MEMEFLKKQKAILQIVDLVKQHQKKTDHNLL